MEDSNTEILEAGLKASIALAKAGHSDERVSPHPQVSPHPYCVLKPDFFKFALERQDDDQTRFITIERLDGKLWKAQIA